MIELVNLLVRAVGVSHVEFVGVETGPSFVLEQTGLPFAVEQTLQPDGRG